MPDQHALIKHPGFGKTLEIRSNNPAWSLLFTKRPFNHFLVGPSILQKQLIFFPKGDLVLQLLQFRFRQFTEILTPNFPFFAEYTVRVIVFLDLLDLNYSAQ